jgi:4-hydroxy-tetrahydrodipicolinate synthase
MFHGSMVALVTPFEQGRVDLPRLRALVEWHIQAGTHAIIAAGTTGEAGTLTHDEKCLVIKTVLDTARERIPVIAGTSANATAACIELTQFAMSCGATAALIMTPAYIKPPQEGLYQHYAAIAGSVGLPIILYNVPQRTACDLLPETVARLATIANIVGIKDATGDMARLQALLTLCGGQLDIYSGDDFTAAEWMLSGAKGVISVIANILPQEMMYLCDAARQGDRELCIQWHQRLAPLMQQLFVQSNPIAVKWVLAQMGLIRDELRLPLTSLHAQYHQELGALIDGHAMRFFNEKQ